MVTFHVTFQFTFFLEINIAVITFGSQSDAEDREMLNNIKLKKRLRNSPQTQSKLKLAKKKVETSIKNIWRQAAAWQWWWWWWLQMPCKLTLWPVELFLKLSTNKTQQKLDTENAQAAKGGKAHKADE